MANQLDGFIEDCNDLQDKINKAMEHKNFDSPLLIEIDEWEKTTIEKVKQVAEQARQQVVQLMNSKKVKIKAQFEKFSQKLIQLKEPNDFVEHDLKQLEQTVHQLNQDLKQLSQVPEIQLHMEQSNQTAWDSLIYVEEKPVYTIKQELQRQVNGKFISRSFF
jgi:DNA primase